MKRESSERAGKVKVLEQGASSIILAAQTAAEEASQGHPEGALEEVEMS